MVNKILVIAFIFLTACGGNPGKKIAPEGALPKTNFELAELFNVGDCKVFRFYDMGYYRYFTTCDGTVNTIKSDSCGKTLCPKNQTIQTVRKYDK